MSENNPFRKAASQKDVAEVEVKDVKVKDVKVKEVKEPEIKMIKVVTTFKGWYKNSRIEEGEELTIPENLFSKIWMQKL